jgi:hypothetical protein
MVNRARRTETEVLARLAELGYSLADQLKRKIRRTDW